MHQVFVVASVTPSVAVALVEPAGQEAKTVNDPPYAKMSLPLGEVFRENEAP